MGWMETCAVDERMRFVMAVESQEEPFAVVCRRFGVSRKTGYKWLARYETDGVSGLLDRSRAPHDHPQAIAAAIRERCLAVRRAHPTWGPVKVRAWLERRKPDIGWPSASTIGALFDREGLTWKRRLRRRCPPPAAPFANCDEANDVWCIDFKGWFRTGDGGRCEPLTLSDAYSRYLLRCQAVSRTDEDHVWPILGAAFREFGLPNSRRSDNGPPFVSPVPGALSELAAALIKAGVLAQRIKPGKPQERPHEALGNATPADHYNLSPRRWDGVLREPEYGAEGEVRRVRQNGEIKWRGNTIYITAALIGEPICLRDDANGGHTVFFGPVVLGIINHGEDRLRKPRA